MSGPRRSNDNLGGLEGNNTFKYTGAASRYEVGRMTWEEIGIPIIHVFDCTGLGVCISGGDSS
jgi:hypothetical protein